MSIPSHAGLHQRDTILTPKKPPKSDPAVSPVIGIMLMLTITLILAAIISGMTGGIAQKQEKPPSLLMDASLVNSTGSNENKSLYISIISVSQSIPTRDLKFITEWRDDGQLRRKVIDSQTEIKSSLKYRYPVGLINTTSKEIGNFSEYSLLPGLRIFANNMSSLQTLFDKEDIPPEGNIVKLQFVHIPSGAIIAEKELTVEGS